MKTRRRSRIIVKEPFPRLPPVAVVLVLMSCGKLLAADGLPHNVETAFTAIGTEGRALVIERDRIDVPSGGHLQGIQMLEDPANDRVLAFLSHDSNTVAYGLVVSFPASLSVPGKIIHVHRFPRDGLRHAGGIQLLGYVLAVGLEDNRGKHRSEVRFLGVSQPTDWKLLDHLTIQRQGLPKDKTAGAVAVANHDGRAIVAVANWDSRAIDFYESNDRDLTDSLCRLKSRGRWVAPADSGSFQAINLVSQANGELYLTGLHLNRRLFNTADLFRVAIPRDGDPILTPVTSRQFHLNQGITFKSGAGLWIRGEQINIVATPHQLAGRIQIDIVRPPGLE